jgi:hypothetical protein
MDDITKSWLEKLAIKYPGYAITLSHQFLDGTDLHECGFVPNDWNGEKIYIKVK